jgi:hypothetical protein
MPTPQDPNVKTVGNDPSKRYRLGKGPMHQVEERANATYTYILEGGTQRQICQRTADRFNVSLRTAFDDYKRAMDLLREEQNATRADILNQVQALRLAVVKSSIKKGMLQNAAILLQQIGTANGEGTEFATAEEVKLNISIEPAAEKEG